MDPDPDVDFDFFSADNSTSVADTMFSMLDALSALPEESEKQVSKRKARKSSFVQTKLLMIQLMAPTSCAIRVNEDSLTYLNQGQPYIMQLSDSYGQQSMLIQSVIRICFYEESMQMMESKHLNHWQLSHPGDRLLDIDLDGCFDYQSAYADPINLNAIVCIWNSTKQCQLSIKPLCVSTDFTAKKHGGERGIPFRIQVDSFYEHNGSHIYSAACQVKVFKTRGADRKNKQDREKIEKKTTSEHNLYREATASTFLDEVSYCPLSRLVIDDQSFASPPFRPSELKLASPFYHTAASSSSSPAFHEFSGDQHHQFKEICKHSIVPTIMTSIPSQSSGGSSILSPSVLQCKRSAQDDIDTGFREISLAPVRKFRQQHQALEVDLLSTNSPSETPLQPMLNGCLLWNPEVDPNLSNSPLSMLPTTLPSWHAVADNVDSLPFSEIGINEPLQTPLCSSAPIRPTMEGGGGDIMFVRHPSSHVITSVSPTPDPQPQQSNGESVFKHPPLRQRGGYEIRNSNLTPDVQRSQKRLVYPRTHPGSAAFPCPGSCSACGHACLGGPVELSVKRQRRRKQMGMRFLRLIRPSVYANSCRSDLTVSTPLAMNQGQAFLPTATSDYHSQSREDDSQSSIFYLPSHQQHPSSSSEASCVTTQPSSSNDISITTDYQPVANKSVDPSTLDTLYLKPKTNDDENTEATDEDEEEDEDEDDEGREGDGDDEDEDYSRNVETKVLAAETSIEVAQVVVSSPSPSPSSALSSIKSDPKKTLEEDVIDAPPKSIAAVSVATYNIPVVDVGIGGRSAKRIRPFRSDMSRSAVANWLRAYGFGSLRSKFAKFSGSDMLRLNRRDLVLLCGTLEGIRLSNAILQKPPRAMCTIYVRHDTESVFHAVYLYHQTEDELRTRLSSLVKLSSSRFSLVLINAHGVNVAINDDVVSYFEDQNCFTIVESEERRAEVFLKKL